MGLRDWYNKIVRKRDAYSVAEDEDRMVERLQQKKLSADERELNKFVEKDRQRQIKQMLQEYRNREKEEVWHGRTALDAPNVIKNQKNLFANQKNIFKMQHSKNTGGDLFFR